MKRIMLWIAGIAIVLMIVVPIIAWFMLKQTDVQGWVSRRVAKATGIQVTMTGYELGFPATLQVHGLGVKTPSGVSLTAKTVVAKPSLLKLLTGSLFLKSVTMDGASVTVPMGLPAPAQPAAATKAGTEPSKPTSVPLEELQIRDAAVHLVRPGGTTDITHVTVTVQPGRRAEITLLAGDPDNRLKLNAELTPANGLKTLHGELAIQKVKPLLALAGAADAPVTEMAGTLTVSLVPKASGYQLDGKLDIPTLSVAMGNPPVPYPISGSFQVQVAADGSLAVLNQATVTIRDTPLQLAGPVYPDLKLALKGEHLDVQSLVSLIPPSETPFPPDFRFTGFASLTGSMTTDGLNASLALKAVQLAIPDVQPITIDGGMNLTMDRIQIPHLLLTGPWIDLSLTGDIRDYLSDHGTTRIDLTGKRLDLTRLAPAPAAASENGHAPNNHATTDTPVAVSYPDFEGMVHTVHASVGSLLLPGVAIRDLNVRLVAGDEAVRLDTCKGRLLDGTVQLTGRLRPGKTGIRMESKGAADRVRLTGLLSNRLPVSGGRLSSRFQLDTAGADTRSLKQHTNGTVSFQVTDAVLRDTPAIRKVEGITKLKLAGRKVKRMEGSGTIRDGLVTLSDTKLSAQGIEVQVTGTVSLLGELDLAVPIRIDQKTASVLPGSLKLLNDNGAVTVPLKVTGTVQQPTVRPDTQALGKAAADKLKKKIKKKWGKKLLKGLFGN